MLAWHVSYSQHLEYGFRFDTFKSNITDHSFVLQPLGFDFIPIHATSSSRSARVHSPVSQTLSGAPQADPGLDESCHVRRCSLAQETSLVNSQTLCILSCPRESHHGKWKHVRGSCLAWQEKNARLPHLNRVALTIPLIRGTKLYPISL